MRTRFGTILVTALSVSLACSVFAAVTDPLAGEAYHTDIEDILKCVRRCAERNEAFVLTSHGIHPDAKHIHMKTEWLERILATAKECGVPCLGFDEL